MPCQPYASLFNPLELDRLTAAFDAAWKKLSPSGIDLSSEDKVALLRSKLAQRILVSDTRSSVAEAENDMPGCRRASRYAALAAAAMFATSVPFPAISADDLWFGPEYQTCAELPTADLVECVGALTAGWERQMKEAFETLQSAEPIDERRHLLRDAQAHWEGYRNAICRWIGIGEGSIAAVEATECRRALTEARARELGVESAN